MSPKSRPAPESAWGRSWVWALKCAARPVVRRAAREALQGRLLEAASPERGRWLRGDVHSFLKETWLRVDEILPEARLHALPSYGNRMNVFMVVVTTAAYQKLIEREVPRDHAATLVADVGWKIYSWMLASAALPARVAIRSPQRRLEWTLRMLMRFPFSAPGPPGYEVKAWSDGERFHTHWTHCPPQSFVRDFVAAHGDRGELDAFYRSWCLYDWAGADLLVGDGQQGHYARPHTLSRGHAVCDMCWTARPGRGGAPENVDGSERTGAAGR